MGYLTEFGYDTSAVSTETPHAPGCEPLECSCGDIYASGDGVGCEECGVVHCPNCVGFTGLCDDCLNDQHLNGPTECLS